MSLVHFCSEVTYVLKCQHGIYYVGKTKSLKHRLSKHFAGKGSACTKRHPPIKLVGLFAGDVEKEKTLYGRNKYGDSFCFGYCYH